MGVIEAPNLPLLAEKALEIKGEHTALIFQGERVSNVTILQRARRLQGAFTELGLAKGDIMALCMVNDPLVYSVFGGGFRTGGTVVPVMFALTATELRYIFSHTEAKIIVTDSMLVDKVREAIEGLDHVQHLVVANGESNPEASPPEYSLADLLQHDEVTTIPDIDPEEIALMLYTSGTTGKPKGVMLAHSNLLGGTKTALAAAEMHIREHPLISISALPMAHIFGVGVMNGGYMVPAEYEAGFGVQEAWFDPERFMQLIQEHKCTDMACVPTMLTMILNHPDIDKYDLTSLAVISVGAAPVPVEVARAISERAGCRIKQLYGMTENAGIGTADRISQPYRPGSAGKPYDACEMKIFDDDDNEVPAGEKGEIVTRGPSTMKGYFKQPEETAAAMKGGWLHTGDIGYFDEDGWLYVVDRKKDMIIKGGENIFPADVENTLYEHPQIGEAAVVGVPDEKYGENVVAYVVKQGSDELTEEDVIAHVKSKVSSFKAPCRVFFVKHLPKSGIGKILRRELREQALEDMASG